MSVSVGVSVLESRMSGSIKVNTFNPLYPCIFQTIISDLDIEFNFRFDLEIKLELELDMAYFD